MNQNEKSEAQLRNEETVRRIMAERGYDRSSVKKKKSNKSFVKPLTLFGLTVIFLVSAVIITIIAMTTMIVKATLLLMLTISLKENLKIMTTTTRRILRFETK